MKLKRFNKFNESFSLNDMSEEERYRWSMGFLDQRGLDPEQDKHTNLVEELHAVWNEELEKKYNCDKYKLMKFTTEELEQIKKEYNNIMENSNKNNSILESTKKELEEKYLSNDAVESIEIKKDAQGEFIQFNVKCETEVRSDADYNGIRLKYNHICEFKNDVSDDDEINEAKMIEYHKNMNKMLWTEFFLDVKNPKS